MIKKTFRRFLPLLLAAVMLLTLVPVGVFAAQGTVVNAGVDGITLSYKGTAAASVTGFTNKMSTDGCYWFFANRSSNKMQSVTIYIENNSGSDGVVSFDYKTGHQGGATLDSSYYGSVVSNDGLLNIQDAGSISSATALVSGSYSGALKDGTTLEIVVSSSDTKTMRTRLDMSNLVFKKTVSGVDVTFEAPENGSYTVNGESITEDTVKTGPSTTNYTLVASAADGYEFFGWYDSNDEVLSYNKEYSFVSEVPCEIRPVFVASGTPKYKVGDDFYSDWNTAMLVASDAQVKVVTLMNNSTLPAGEYVIPEAVTLLVPFNEEGTLYTTDPECFDETWAKPEAFRTLTLADGAEIVVNGALSLSAPHTPAAGAKKNGGSPYIAYGHISMDEGSKISVNNGGTLYAYGYITGDGSVYAESGASVFEYFQIMDFKGGSATTDMTQSGKHVLPLSQYYVQNIEVPLTLESGASEYCFTSVKMSGQIISAAVGFIGTADDVMFKHTSGTLVKSYDGSTDRLVAQINGNVDIAPIVIDAGELTIDSKKFVLPINNNITIKVNSGKVNITQDLALLPGAQLIISKDAKCTLENNCNVFVYDSDLWGNFVGASSSNGNKGKFADLSFAPGRTYQRTDSDIIDASVQVDGVLDASKGYLYTTQGGANIFTTEDGRVLLRVGDTAITYQFEYLGATVLHYGEYHEIPVTPAKLKNADGTYSSCTEDVGSILDYKFTDGNWESIGHILMIDEGYPAHCEIEGLSDRIHCTKCGDVLVEAEVIPPLGHDLKKVSAKIPTYTSIGWTTHQACSRCDYKVGYEEIQKLPAPVIDNYLDFITNLDLLESYAADYVKTNPAKDPAALVIKYIRTGVERYTEGSWSIMAGYEDADFAKYVAQREDGYNSSVASAEYMVKVSGLKNIEEFELPNGHMTDFGHLFGSLDIAYHNNFHINHIDVGGWAGDLVDLLDLANAKAPTGTMEEIVKVISEECMFHDFEQMNSFDVIDIRTDFDSLYVINSLKSQSYEKGDLAGILREYYTEELTDVQRADYFIDNRMDSITLRNELRDAIYNAYTSNRAIATLEGTRTFTASNIAELRKASCYAFADYVCELAGDFVKQVENSYFTVFSNETSNLAPGIKQNVKFATSADGKQMAYYLATADLTRDDVHIYANYNNNDPASGWGMQRVLDQANAAQNKYGNPESENYIKNYNVIASINGSGYNMATGEPGGLLVMNGVEYHAPNDKGFFGILDDGTPVIGTTEEYNGIYKDRVAEGIAGFGSTLITDGKINITGTSDYYLNRASRTAVGITKTGKVVFMVLDGRQEPFSCGGSMEEIAQIMFEAGCVEAINLDGGGSSTFVAKREGADELSVVNSPSDGTSRSVSTSLMMVSTAPSSTAFDHAIIDSEYDYLTVGTSINLSASGVSATGNAADIPEGTSWTVADSSVATITDEGVLTATGKGSITVNLVLGEEILATKTLYVVVPDTIYFTKSNINAVYGAKTLLPVKGIYDGKFVAINPDDVIFTLSNDKAGYFEEFSFTGDLESGIKTVQITAVSVYDSSVSGSISVSLYKQGEVAFDFEQATGGDKEMAWDRAVSNSTTEDGTIYYVVDANEKMTASYVFAIDMSQIKIPEQLADLTYMLPGSDSADASAWTFLCQLAERMSTLTEVKAKVTFDPNVDVDYENLSIINDCFTLATKEFDEESNTLTVTLKWVKQSQPIDVSMANPVCLLSGIKLTPKDDAQWDDKNVLTVVNIGEIGYTVYMRATGLYNFATKAENQAEYGIYPFINPDNSAERGGYFSSTYKEFTDTFVLVNSLKNGWVNEDGGYAYYEQGVKYYDVREIGGVYYNFGSDGINVGMTPHTGLFYDPHSSGYRFTKNGIPQAGWQYINGEWYYFNADYTPATGHKKLNGVYLDFEGNGKLVSGKWVFAFDGWRYYYGPDYHEYSWHEIDGELYYFRNGCRLTGIQNVPSMENKAIHKWYDFGEDGICRDVSDGVHIDAEGKERYFINKVPQDGLFKINDEYYFFLSEGGIVKNTSYYVWETHCDLPCSTYYFDEEGKIPNGFVEKDGELYFYVNGKEDRSLLGLNNIDGDYYFIDYGGICRTGYFYAWDTNCELPCGYYEFGEDGKMLQGVVQKDSGVYYYVNGKEDRSMIGLNKIDGDYYFIDYGGICKTGKFYVWETNCDLPCGHYEFGDDGKMLQGFVEKADGVYYYVNGNEDRSLVGLNNFDGDYYFIDYGGICRTGYFYVWDTNCELPCGNYEFDENGKMLQGFVEKADGIYYYVNGREDRSLVGLNKIGDDYYFIDYGGICKTGKFYVWETNCDLPCGNYEFGEDGKMLHGLVEKEDGIYYYVNGNEDRSLVGLNKFGDDYYFVDYDGLCKTGKFYVWKTNCDLPCGQYEFGEDGKLLQGIVEKDGVLYCYVNGQVGKTAGLVKIDDDYYFVDYDGTYKTGKYYAWATQCDLPCGHYEFGTDGKALDGFVQKTDGIYYYVNGQPGKVGINYIDGYYYFVDYGGKIFTDGKYYAWEGNEILVEKNYVFNEVGQIVG